MTQALYPAVFDGNEAQAYGFAEVKCPCEHENVSSKKHVVHDKTVCCDVIIVGGS